MAEDLSAADRSSLAAEQGPVSMAVGGLLVFEAGEGLRYERVLERVAQRLHLLPRYRQRLQSSDTGLVNPVWVDDDDFELRLHVRRGVVDDPGDDAALAHFVGLEMSRRLDRTRPLWELTVIEGLSAGRAAVLARMHHALVDGVAAVDIGTVLLDPSPDPVVIDPPRQDWEPRPYDRRRHLARLAATPVVSAQKLVLESVTRALSGPPAPDEVRRAATDMRRATDVLIELARTRPSAPMTPLNAGLGPNRSFATHVTPLPVVKAAARAQRATVNDALLATVAGMLARYLRAAGQGPDRPLVALVPVSVRKSGVEGGNHISTVLVDLPVAEDDPAARIRSVSAAMRELKHSAAVRAGAVMVGASGWAPPLVSANLAKAMGSVRAFNLVVSNVPGPQQPFWMNGCRLLRIHPVVPLNPASQGLTVGILSYDGTVSFGLLADRDLDPGVDVAADALRAALAEL